MKRLAISRPLRLLLAALLLAVATFGQTPEMISMPQVDAAMNQAVASGLIPGGVVLVGHNGHVVFRKAYGWRSLEPAREPMTEDTVFDLASLTKCVATATSVMKLEQEGRLNLDDAAAKYLPAFTSHGMDKITLRMLLTHFSGLREDLDLKSEWSGHDAAFRMAMDEKPVSAPGTQFRYSDINYIVLGFIVEKISGQSLDAYAAANIFAPLGMSETSFAPPAAWLPRTAPTEYDEQQHMLRGQVHDPTARRMGGVAGHAGVFSTAGDLATFAEEMLGDHRVLNAQALALMTSPQQPVAGAVLRGIGWDIDSPYSGLRGEYFPVGGFGHTGFTGTSLWIDPATDSYVILLTNRVHPRGGRSINALRAQVATAAAQALPLTAAEQERLRQARETKPASHLPRVRTGIDVLEAHDFAELRALAPAQKPVRVAVVTNQTGVDSAGRRTVDVLAHAPGVQLAAIFSPEHGIAGTADTTKIGDSRDASTGVPILSVYGDSDARRRPSQEALRAVDAIVFDLQDAGARFYTYETTLGYFLEAATQADKPIFVLDHPNPINGLAVQGPISDAGRESFTNYTAIPVRHGMTLGELARLFNAERKINARLTVIALEGWHRGDWQDATGLAWVNPSPNLRNLAEATFYPGLGMIEFTNLSVGRGTPTPFEVVGAPWIHAAELAAYLTARKIAGVSFAPAEFTPSASVHAHQKCGGVRVTITDRDALDAPLLGVEIAAALIKLYPHQYDTAKLDGLMVNDASARALLSGADPRAVAAEWQKAIAAFQSTRAKFLLY